MTSTKEGKNLQEEARIMFPGCYQPLGTWFTDESKSNDYRMIYVVKIVRVPN